MQFTSTTVHLVSTNSLAGCLSSSHPPNKELTYLYAGYDGPSKDNILLVLAHYVYRFAQNSFLKGSFLLVQVLTQTCNFREYFTVVTSAQVLKRIEHTVKFLFGQNSLDEWKCENCACIKET